MVKSCPCGKGTTLKCILMKCSPVTDGASTPRASTSTRPTPGASIGYAIGWTTERGTEWAETDGGGGSTIYASIDDAMQAQARIIEEFKDLDSADPSVYRVGRDRHGKLIALEVV